MQSPDTFFKYDTAIKQTLAIFFEDSILRANEIHPRYGLLWQELARVTQVGGKRVRPKAAILAYQAFDGKRVDSILPVAAALEIFHTSLLIHDDIIDRELVRRGELNISGAYEQTHYHQISEPLHRRHYSDSAALLGGDLLLTAAFQLINECSLPRARVIAAQDILHRIVFEVGGGQLLDSEMAFLHNTPVPAELVARYKTASYSFIGPFLTGATLASVDVSSLKLLEAFAIDLGIAYQLNDDLLGVFGDETKTGKSTTSDLREGKKTFLVEHFMQLADTHDVTLFNASFGSPTLTNSQAQSLKALIETSGARAKTEAQRDEHTRRARRILAKLDISDTSRDQFESFIQHSLNSRTV